MTHKNDVVATGEAGKQFTSTHDNEALDRAMAECDAFVQDMHDAGELGTSDQCPTTLDTPLVDAKTTPVGT